MHRVELVATREEIYLMKAFGGVRAPLPCTVCVCVCGV
jgi:hypothetical protein